MTQLSAKKKSHSRMILLVKLLIVCLFIVSAATLVFRQEVGMLGTVLLQPRSGCTFAEALEGGRSASHIRKRVAELSQASRILERDAAGYVLWRTPLGDFWAPERDT